MEDPEMPNHQSSVSTVDTSRPFSSVKEAVAVFGERLLTGEAFSSSPKPCANIVPLPSSITTSKEENEYVLDSLKKLEAELEETKEELRLLKEREEDTEVALASLNAELHKNMSKLAEAEAKAAATRRIAMGCERGKVEEERKRSSELKKMMRMEETGSPTLAQILSFGDKIGYFGGKKEKKKIKKKPIIPLVGDLLLTIRKKGSSENALLPSSFNSFN